MGVSNLWKALEKAQAVCSLEGATHHAQIREEVEGKVVAIDLSAWLMQAQTQPALLEHYDSDYARAVKVVFDRTIHWLRHGCLPVFVIEGQTPAAKLDKLRQRCIAQYGPSAGRSVGNRAGGHFDRLGQTVRRLLEAMGVPCVQAVGEGEAMCAALNLCGWAHACHTLDVDVLLFGALTVYRQTHLQTDDPRRSILSVCRRSDVQRVLGIQRGGDAALVAVAQLAGGDYDVGGADNVGEALALGAVRCLLNGCEDDDGVLQRLEEALSAGPDPALDALTKCTGCKTCGHEGGMKSRITKHTARHGGCVACGCSDGCLSRQWSQCECEFHSRADERLLNRVVRRAIATPGFVSSCRAAAAAYQQQLEASIAAVQREYGLPVPGSSRNVFTWSRRPDVCGVSEVMCRYIKDWDYHQVRLKLLPLLLEWDVRQGPRAALAPSTDVQFRPTGIRKVSSKGADDITGVAPRQQQGWRYVLQVERLQQRQPAGHAAARAGGTMAAAAAAGVDEAAEQEAEDLAIDLAWIHGTARSKPAKQAVSVGEGGLGTQLAADRGFSMSQVGTQMTQQLSSQQGDAGASCSQAAAAAAADAGSARGAGGSGGGRSGGSLQFSEHRSVRCSLMDAVWPDLVAAYRNPPATSGRGKSSGSRKAHQEAPATPGVDKQRSVKEFFGVVKDYAVPAKPLHKGRQNAAAAAATGCSIPGLADLAAPHHNCSSSRFEAAVAVSPNPGLMRANLGTGLAAASGVGGAGDDICSTDLGYSSTKSAPLQQSGIGFMQWLEQELAGGPSESQEPALSTSPSDQRSQQQQLQQQQLNTWQGDGDDSMLPFSPAPAAAAAAAGRRCFVGVASGNSDSTRSAVRQGGASGSRRTARAAAAGYSAGGPAGSASRSAKGRAAMPVGAMERFLRPAAASPVQQQQQEQQQQQQKSRAVSSNDARASPLLVIGHCCESPDVLPLAARLAASKCQAAAASTAAPAAVISGTGASKEPPAKKQCSPQKPAGGDGSDVQPGVRVAYSLFEAAAPAVPQQQQQKQKQQQQEQLTTCPPNMSAPYYALLQEAGAFYPEQLPSPPRPRQQQVAEVIELLDDSPCS